MSDPFLGEIRVFAFNFVPYGWLPCDGRTLNIQQYSALYALLGTFYGGDGRTTFALPDLQGRVPIDMGTGPGLSVRNFGQKGGQEKVTLAFGEMPLHSHPLKVNTNPANTDNPAGGYPANTSATAGNSYASTNSGESMNPDAIGPAGGGLPHDNMPPFLALNFCIAVQGMYPTRD